MFELVQQILSDMRSHKLRSFLALFGIVWGTVSVVVLLALGQGFYTMGKESVSKLSAGHIFAMPRSTTLSYQGMPEGQQLHVKASDVMALRNVLDIRLLTPKLRSAAQIVYKGQAESERVSGVAADFGDLNKLTFDNGGRFVNENDEELARRVVVLGPDIAKNLFHFDDPVGQAVTIQGLPFMVIGVVEKNLTGINFGDGFHPRDVFIPYTTFNVLFGDEDISYFALLPQNADEMDATKQSITRFFAKKYHFDPDDEDAIMMPNISQFADFFTLFFLSVKLFLGFCGAMTLGVGGVGVANIMFLVISERTREIGLRMALGAKDYQILSQILLEAFVIVMIGALVGFACSWLVIEVLQGVTLPAWMGTPAMSMSSVFSTIGILGVVALLAGYFPARRASKLDPVVALSS